MRQAISSRACPRRLDRRCKKGSFASPIFIRSALVILLFSRTIKFPVMVRFRLSEEARSSWPSVSERVSPRMQERARPSLIRALKD